jgi:hypothetical protein
VQRTWGSPRGRSRLWSLAQEAGLRESLFSLFIRSVFLGSGDQVQPSVPFPGGIFLHISHLLQVLPKVPWMGQLFRASCHFFLLPLLPRGRRQCRLIMSVQGLSSPLSAPKPCRTCPCMSSLDKHTCALLTYCDLIPTISQCTNCYHHTHLIDGKAEPQRQ